MRLEKKHTSVAITVAGAWLAAHLISTLFAESFEVLDARLFDRFVRWRYMSPVYRPAVHPAVVHVDLSNETIERTHKGFWSRADFAQVMSNLHAVGVTVQVWDMYFPAQSAPEEDAALATAVRHCKTVILGMVFRDFGLNVGLQTTPSFKNPIPIASASSTISRAGRPAFSLEEIRSEAAATGFLNLPPDADGVFRRIPMLAAAGDEIVPGLALAGACAFLEVHRVELTHSTSPQLALVHANESKTFVPVDREARLLVNYVSPWYTSQSAHQPEFPALKHLDMGVIFQATHDRDLLEILREDLTGKIAVISDVRAGAEPLGHTPLDPEFPLSGIVAQAINTLLSGKFLRTLPMPAALALEAVMLLFVAGLALSYSPLRLAVATVGILIMYGMVAFLTFRNGGWALPIARPILAVSIASSVSALLEYLRETKAREVLRRSFEAYFPPAIVKRILAQPDLITDAGNKRELTILFSDIQGFTSLSETMPPDELRRLLNEYFGVMVEIVFRNGGTVDKFIGDGLMVFFGDPEPQPDHAVRCVQAAIEMQQALQTMRQEWQRHGKPILHVRIGINTGNVVVGNMGSQRRLSYTVLGAAVNLAQRLESNAPTDGILISERTHELLEGRFPSRSIGPISIKGSATKTPVHVITWEPSS
jgi:adenylate cyclase